MHIFQSELTPQIRKMVQQTLSTHEPLKISIGDGQTAILLTEHDYNQMLGILNQIKTPITQQTGKQRTFGSSKGLIKMADDFDAPLDDFKDYM